jgi:hypothetical protein
VLSNGAERHIDQDASDERRNQKRRYRPHGVETVFESGLKVRTEAVSKGLGLGAQQQTERPRNDGAHQDGPAGSRPRLRAMSSAPSRLAASPRRARSPASDSA